MVLSYFDMQVIPYCARKKLTPIASLCKYIYIYTLTGGWNS